MTGVRRASAYGAGAAPHLSLYLRPESTHRPSWEGGVSQNRSKYWRGAEWRDRAAVTRDPPAQLAPRPNGARHSRTTLLHTLDTNSRRSRAMWHASGAMRCHRLHPACPSVRPSVRARVALIARSLAGTTRHAHRRAQLEEKVKIKPKFVSWLAGDGVREPCHEVREGRQCVVTVVHAVGCESARWGGL